MQHDNHNNHQIDQQLRELEQYSLPDLSKQDDHWKSMAAMIGTSMMMPGVQPRKGFFSRSIVKWITGAVVVGGAAFIVYVIATDNKNESGHATHAERLTEEHQAPQPADTAKAIPVNPVTSDSGTIAKKDTIMSAAGNWDIAGDTIIKRSPTIVQDKRNNTAGKTVVIPDNERIAKVDSFIANNSANTAVIPTAVKQLNEFFRKLQKKPQQFRINNGRDTVLRGKEGTVLHIPKNSFNVNGTITIRLIEFYSIEDMITNKLSTVTTDGRQLVSGGMVHISASKANSDSVLSLRKGINWRLEMPKTTDSSMQLFYGRTAESNEMFDRDVKWEATGQTFQQPAKIFFGTTKKSKSTSGIKKEAVDTLYSISASANIKDPTNTTPTITYDTLATGLTATLRAMDVEAGDDKAADALVGFKYGVTISQLGWINCDRFPALMERTNLSVNLDTPWKYRTMIVFQRFNSIMPGTTMEKGRSTFNNIPVGEKVKVICIGFENNKALCAMRELIVQPNQQFDLTFEEVDVPAFVRQLQPPKSQ